MGNMKIRRNVSKVLVLLLLIGAMFGSYAFTSAADYSKTRVAGADRYGTSENALDTWLAMGKMAPQNLVVTSGANYPDALSGAYLAYVKKAPLVLTSKSNDEKVIANLLQKIPSDQAGTVYILGGPSAVSEEFEAKAVQAGYTVKRLGGKDRYETNLLVLEEADAKGKEIMLCSGNSYADSLSASGVTRPILLVNKKLTDAQKEFLSGSPSKSIHIIGGTSAVSADVEKEAKQFGNTDRVGGSNRFETSSKVADYFFGNRTDNVVLSYGMNYPDGLVAGPLAMRKSAPILLVEKKNFSFAREYIQENKITKVTAVGGTGVIPDNTIDAIMNPDSTEALSFVGMIASQVKEVLKVSPTKQKVVAFALDQAKKGVMQSCYTLVVNSYKSAGINIVDAYNGTYRNAKGELKQAVRTSTPEPGDIALYTSHVAIYIGVNERGEAMAVHGGWYGDGHPYPGTTTVWTVRVSWPTFLGYWSLDV